MEEYPNNAGYPNLGFLQLNNYPTHSHEVIQNELNKVIQENVQTNTDGKNLYVSFSVTWEQVELFNKLTGYVLKTIVDKKGNAPPHNTHWLLAGLHAVAEKEIGYIRSKPDSVEIGPAPGSFAHSDSKLDARDEARFVQKHSLITHESLLRILRGEHSQGAEKCNIPSTDAVALFSTQDMSYSDVYSIFEAKGLQTMTAAMLLPIQYYNDSQSFTDSVTEIHWKHHGSDIIMCMPDKSFNYSHSRVVIEQWLKQCGYNGKAFNLSFEIQRSYGPLCIIKIVRTHLAGKVSRTMRIADSKLIKLPDFAEIIPIVEKLTSGFWSLRFKPEEFYSIFSKVKKYTVTKKILEKTTQFLFNREDKTVTRNHASSYISGQAYQITVRSWCIQEGFFLTPEEHEGLSTALLIRAMIVRWRSTKQVGYLVRQIQKADNCGFSSIITRFYNTIASPWTRKGWSQWFDRNRTSIIGDKVLNMSRAHYYMLCVLRIFGDETVVEEFEFSRHDRVSFGHLPLEKDATFDPDNEGFCYHECHKFIHGFWPNIVANPTVAEIVAYEKAHKLSNNIKLDNGHATVEFKTIDVCEHIVMHDISVITSGRPSCPLIEDYMENLSAYYSLPQGNKNIAKTKLILDFFGRDRKWNNLCAGPGNDAIVFPNGTLHWYKLGNLGTIRCNNLPKDDVVQFNKNLNCERCLSGISGVLYCDYGVDASNAPEQIAIALEKVINTGNNYIFKIQDFFKSCNSSYNLNSIVDKHCKILKLQGSSPWERYVTNMLDFDAELTTDGITYYNIKRYYVDHQTNIKYYLTRDYQMLSQQDLSIPGGGPKQKVHPHNILVQNPSLLAGPAPTTTSKPPFNPTVQVPQMLSAAVPKSTNHSSNVIPLSRRCKKVPSITSSHSDSQSVSDLISERSDLICFDSDESEGYDEVDSVIDVKVQVHNPASTSDVVSLCDDPDFVSIQRSDSVCESLDYSIVSNHDYDSESSESEDETEAIDPVRKLEVSRIVSSSIIKIVLMRTVIRAFLRNVKPSNSEAKGASICLCKEGACEHPYLLPSQMQNSIIPRSQLPQHDVYYGYFNKSTFIPNSLPEVVPSEHVYNSGRARAEEEMKRLKESLKVKPDSPFFEAHSEAIKTLDPAKLRNNIKFEAVLGNPGAGKSTWLVKQFEKDPYYVDYIVVPYRALADEYNEKLGNDEKKKYAITFASAISKVRGSMKIAIDEAFAFDPRVLWFLMSVAGHVIILGDDRQQHFNIDNLELSTFVPDLATFCKGASRLETSFSVPHDIIRYVREYFGYEYRTLSRVLRSIEVNYTPKMKDPDIRLTFSTNSKEKKNGVTIASVQGMRIGKARLTVTAKCHQLALQVKAQLYVAVTRHTKKLEVVVQTEKAARMFPSNQKIGSRNRFPTIFGPSTNASAVRNEGPFNLQKAQVEGNSPPSDVVDEQSEDFGQFNFYPNVVSHGIMSAPMTYTINQSIHSNLTDLDYDMVGDSLYDSLSPGNPVYDDIDNLGVSNDSVQMTEEILSEIAPSLMDIADDKREVAYTEFGVPNRTQTFNLREKNRPIINDRPKPGVHALSMGRVRGRQQTNSDLDHNIHSVLSRQTYLKRKMRPSELNGEANKLWRGLNTFVDLKKLAKMQLSSEELTMYQTQQIENIHKKNNPDKHDLGLYGENTFSTSKISLFNKHQHKVDLRPNGAFRGDETVIDGQQAYVYKCGQMISAQTSTLNQLGAAHVMALEKRIKACLRKGVLLPNGEDPQVFKKEVSYLLSQRIPDTVNMACDISEQDTTKTEATHLMFWWLLESIGMPRSTYDAIQYACSKWTGFGQEFSMNNVDTFQSGIIWTYLNNTLDSMARIGASFRFGRLQLAMFKGDDSYVSAQSIECVEMRKEFKLEYGKNLPFVGFIVAENTLGLDLPRLCAKVINKSYRENKDLEEYMLAVRDWINHISNKDEIAASCAAVSSYYGCTDFQSEALWSFLYNYSRGHVIATLRQRSVNFITSRLQKVILGKPKVNKK